MGKATIQYRQLKVEGLWDQIELKPMLVDVLRRRGWADNAKARVLDIDQDKSFVILNKVFPLSMWDGPVFAGQLIHLQDGTDVHAVLQSLDVDTPEFLVESLNVGERARVLKGALYFAIVGNHIGLIEGQQVRGRTLERYLTALFQKADELDAGQAIILNSKFMVGDGKQLDDLTEIIVAAQPNRGTSPGDPSTVEQIVERERARARDSGKTVFDVLRVLGWSPEALASLQHEVPDDGWIEGFFRFSIKERRRKKKPISRATINEALRNIDPADIGLRGDGTEKGGVVKLSIQKEIKTISSLLDPADGWNKS